MRARGPCKGESAIMSIATAHWLVHLGSVQEYESIGGGNAMHRHHETPLHSTRGMHPSLASHLISLQAAQSTRIADHPVRRAVNQKLAISQNCYDSQTYPLSFRRFLLSLTVYPIIPSRCLSFLPLPSLPSSPLTSSAPWALVHPSTAASSPPPHSVGSRGGEEEGEEGVRVWSMCW